MKQILDSFRAELATGWDFFGISYFGLDRKILKIPKSRGSGSGFENPENLKIPRIGTGILKPLKNPEKSRKSRNPGDRDWDLKIP